MKTCPFCQKLASKDLLRETLLAAALVDAYPISPGHMLVVPKRHVDDFFDLSNEERLSIWELVETIRKQIQADKSPDGFNIGINAGAAAGQTVPHAHVHIIPRFEGDREDPRGGIRWILPEKAKYW
ncbi:HIT family protein [Elusimicrobiota bacterium]